MPDKKHIKENDSTAKKDTKQHSAPKAKSAASNTVKSNRLKLLITIIARKKAEYFTDLIQSFDVNMQMVVLAEGTANAKMLGLLGLLDSEKAVIFSVIQENKVADAMSMLEHKFQTIKDGKGVACTIPLTSVIGTLIYGFLSNNRMTVKESK
ncbi:MAG: hypothetical protein K2O31_00240 [Clostridia bacterium]|nr:hypothetical protein [Clostridia bacterium]MDE6210687.1 hypothetical protein [Clostridia bacterium]MDE6869349.1 hypothetical protein [Clostridia bacterium]MDE7208293.1 hypothetical protein [Clostridia bacterium]